MISGVQRHKFAGDGQGSNSGSLRLNSKLALNLQDRRALAGRSWSVKGQRKALLHTQFNLNYCPCSFVQK